MTKEEKREEEVQAMELDIIRGLIRFADGAVSHVLSDYGYSSPVTENECSIASHLLSAISLRIGVLAKGFDEEVFWHTAELVNINQCQWMSHEDFVECMRLEEHDEKRSRLLLSKRVGG